MPNRSSSLKPAWYLRLRFVPGRPLPSPVQQTALRNTRTNIQHFRNETNRAVCFWKNLANFVGMKHSIDFLPEHKQRDLHQLVGLIRTSVHGYIYFDGSLENHLFQRSTGYESACNLRGHLAEVQLGDLPQFGTTMKHFGSGSNMRSIHFSDLDQIRTIVKCIHHIGHPCRIESRNADQCRAAIANLVHRLENRGIEFREACQRRISPKQLLSVSDLIQAAGAVHKCRFIDQYS